MKCLLHSGERSGTEARDVPHTGLISYFLPPPPQQTVSPSVLLSQPAGPFPSGARSVWATCGRLPPRV